jgi:GTP-binding protein
MLLSRKSLAKTSGTPGKTQLINHFIINNKWFVVDLPGYGYAKVSKTLAATWEKFIHNYLTKRETLQCTMVLIDSRLPPQRIDLEFVNSLGEMGLPFVLVFTKADKQSNKKTTENVALFKQELRKQWDELPQVFVTSAEKGVGRDEILDFIEQTNKTFIAPVVEKKEEF